VNANSHPKVTSPHLETSDQKDAPHGEDQLWFLAFPTCTSSLSRIRGHPALPPPPSGRPPLMFVWEPWLRGRHAAARGPTRELKASRPWFPVELRTRRARVRAAARARGEFRRRGLGVGGTSYTGRVRLTNAKMTRVRGVALGGGTATWLTCGRVRGVNSPRRH
jgi:hypothetical protein